MRALAGRMDPVCGHSRDQKRPRWLWLQKTTYDDQLGIGDSKYFLVSMSGRSGAEGTRRMALVQLRRDSLSPGFLPTRTESSHRQGMFGRFGIIHQTF